MDLQSELQKHFSHLQKEKPENLDSQKGLWICDTPILCKFEKRNGKINTVLCGYDGNKEDYKELARLLKKHLGVGGGIQANQIVIQGDYRNQIMAYLEKIGFKTKRVGG